ncbi:MAG TPA: hypothetical protein VF017_16055 [Thermoanaerobaculia bacterium]|nr:hypothetical protein [Thermoanaerobaculia bacterium]
MNGARRLLAAGLLALIAATPARADFLDRYKQGLEAIEKKAWGDAATALRAAIAERPEENDRLPKKLYFKRYLPHFYLGVALAELGDCDGALAAWRESERQGVVQRFEEHKRLKEGRNRCGERLSAAAALEDALAVSREAVRKATEARNEAMAALSALPAGGNEANSASFASSEQEANRSLESARERLATAREKSDLEAARESAEQADRATRLYHDLTAEVRRAGETAQAERAAAAGELGTLLANAQRALDSMPLAAPFPPEVGRRRDEVAALITEGKRLGPSASPATVTDWKGRLDAGLGRLRKALVPPPAELQEAARLLFAADYEGAVARLALVAYTDRRTQAHALLLRSAARYLLYLEGGAKDAALLVGARADLAASRDADAGVKLARDLFSPRFVAFYDQETGQGR